MPEHDIWSKWLLESRFGDRHDTRAAMEQVKSLRDKVLQHAGLTGNETLLDVGSGDGLIAFGALARLGPNGGVIFADISRPLLDHARGIAERLGVADRCQFVQASADDLSFLPDNSVDVVTTRSVLIYVADKLKALREFRRVLKTGGRISLFETITLPGLSHPDEKWPGIGLCVYKKEELAPILELITRFVGGFDSVKTQSMLATDHIGYLHLCENAGFRTAGVELHLGTQRRNASLEHLLNQSLNPHFPTPAEHMEKIFSPAERERFTSHMRALIEKKSGITRSANAFIWAVKE
jgi:ubiquinone/menaquinone biosynthesis C-methylase UbiE